MFNVIRKYFLFVSIFLSLNLSFKSFAQIRYELSGSVGTMKTAAGSENYNEAELGLTYSVNKFIDLRGSAFTRFTRISYSGVNLSSRFILGYEAGDFQITSFVGPGYRFMSRGLHAPLAEGGIGFSYPGLYFSLGYRILFNEAVDNGLENDGQFFIGFNGVIGGGLSLSN